MPRQVAGEVQEAPGLGVGWEAGLEDDVVRAAWSPDGSRLAAALISGPVVVFDCEGRRPLDLPGHEFGTLSLSWRADGSVLATGGKDSQARLWDAASGRLLHSLEAGKDWVEQVAFSPSGDLLMTASGRTVRLWSGSGELLRDYPPHPSTVADVQWQPNELFFATAAYGQLATFGPEVIEPAKRFAWKGSILTIAWSPDGSYIATGN
jgi:WD40 repeat protein